MIDTQNSTSNISDSVSCISRAIELQNKQILQNVADCCGMLAATKTLQAHVKEIINSSILSSETTTQTIKAMSQAIGSLTNQDTSPLLETAAMVISDLSNFSLDMNTQILNSAKSVVESISAYLNANRESFVVSNSTNSSRIFHETLNEELPKEMDIFFEECVSAHKDESNIEKDTLLSNYRKSKPMERLILIITILSFLLAIPGFLVDLHDILTPQSQTEVTQIINNYFVSISDQPTEDTPQNDNDNPNPCIDADE